MIEKNAIIISWPREIDFYSEFLNDNQNFDLIVNDFSSYEKGRNFSNEKIIEILKDKNIKFERLSKIFRKKKYKVLISTGEISGFRLSAYSIARFFYGQTIGRLLDFFSVSSLIEKFTGRTFTADGKNSRLGLSWFPEKEIANKVIKFPDGLDIKTKNYPYKVFDNVFDVYFSYSDLEIDLINKKYNEQKKCKKIDYFRYCNINKSEEKKNSFISKFNLDKNKKIIYWLPTHIDNYADEDKNITEWFKKLSHLNKKFNLIIKPHPKTISRNKKIIQRLKNYNFIIDLNFDQKIGEILYHSDLIFSDYGGIVFDSLYFQKKIILLNLQETCNYVKDLKANESLDLQIRRNLPNLDSNLDSSSIEKEIEDILENKMLNQNNLAAIKEEYFGKTKPLSFKEVVSFIKGS